ncbi:hypothetical protein [Parablautia intestinalis]|uniref:hypothetical protein n=1 Tax=Parablautia intestinalis TaxID=2320100 RepID=UPI0023C951B9|nr:hypothetical protein [Parablautia intestinalis]MDE7047048.1 hypothetical protein [Lachnospiraceae bacterium]
MKAEIALENSRPKVILLSRVPSQAHHKAARKKIMLTERFIRSPENITIMVVSQQAKSKNPLRHQLFFIRIKRDKAA